MTDKRKHPKHVSEAWSLEDFCRALDLSKRRVHELQRRGVLPKASSYCVRSRRPRFLSLAEDGDLPPATRPSPDISPSETDQF